MLPPEPRDAAARRRRPARARRAGAGGLGVPESGAGRPRRPAAVHRAARHRQVAGRGGGGAHRGRDRPAGRRRLAGGVEVDRRDREEPGRRLRRRRAHPGRAAARRGRRPVRHSAPRSTTRTTATPTCETAYLLQRLDSFDGLVVLTTNLRQNIDAAFLRRMDFVVEFPLPDEAGPDPAVAAAPAGARAARRRRRSRRARPALPGPRRLDPQRRTRRRLPRGALRRRRSPGEHLVLRAMRREYAKAARPFPGEPPTVSQGGEDHERLRRDGHRALAATRTRPARQPLRGAARAVRDAARRGRLPSR